MTNPGGFPEGITADNILVHEPKPRNPRLAEAFKRIGLVEQTGRGVDKIFMGQLRYGRPAPDYSRSDARRRRLMVHSKPPHTHMDLTPVWTTLLYTGIRENQLIELRWGDWDRRKAKIHLSAKYAKTHRDVWFSLDPEVQAVLEQLYKDRQLTKTGVAPPPKASEHIFLSGAGRPWRNNLLTRFKRCCRLAGIETSYPRDDGVRVVVDLHALRVTFASVLLEQGADEKAVQVLMQRTDISLTRNIYQKVRDGKLDEALACPRGAKDGTVSAPPKPNSKGGEAAKP